MENNHYILTGPPCSGKTNTLEKLEERGFAVLGEVQMEVIALYKRELGGEDEWLSFINNPDGTKHKAHFYEFIDRCVDLQITREKRLKDIKQPVFFDRSSLDCLSFAQLRGLSNMRATQWKVYTHMYSLGTPSGIFHFPLLDEEFEKRKKEGRSISQIEARKFDAINHETYSSGVDIPIGLDVNARVSFILSQIAPNKCREYSGNCVLRQKSFALV